MNHLSYRLVKRMQGVFIFTLLLLGLSLIAQAPQAFKYQAVVRDSAGAPIVLTNVSVRISILSGGIEGVEVYREVHNVLSSSGGLITLNIGSGTPDIGGFDQIVWGLDDFYVKVEVDPLGGVDYIFMGASQLLSVPYAIYAKEAGGPPSYTWEQLQDHLANRTTHGAEPGMMVFVSDESKMVYYNGAGWVTTGGECFPQPSLANAGEDQEDVEGTSTLLGAESPKFGTGIWSIISEENGQITNISDIYDPQAFLETTGGNFVLQWTVTNECGVTSDQVYITFCPDNTIALAGSDQFNIIGTTAQLAANLPDVGNTGAWSIESGNGGEFSAVNDPNAVFTGLPGEIYTLRWTIATGCEFNFDLLQVGFCYTLTIAEAGPDQINVEGTTTALAGNEPAAGNTGLWTIVSGLGGEIASPGQYNSIFNGAPDSTYVLRWTINTVCEESFDEVTVYFCPVLTIADAGPDQTDIDGISLQLAANTAGSSNNGMWAIESSFGPMTTGDEFVDPTDPQTIFNGVAGTTYNLSWTISTVCDESVDLVTISFCPELTLADAGVDALNVCGIFTLLGNEAGAGNASLWEIIAGNNGVLTNPDLPNAQLEGLQGEEYILTYTISNACGSNSDTVVVSFEALPSVADAGPDQENIDGTSTFLEAVTPVNGVGTWTVLTGTGGTFVNDTDPQTEFFGQPNEAYSLLWTVTNLCNQSTTDTVLISFCPTLVSADAGPDETLACLPHTLQGNEPGDGNEGEWIVISGTGYTFCSVYNPTAAFSGSPGETYELAWTISNTCGFSSDTVIVSFDVYPTTALAGPDQLNVEVTTLTLAANTPSVGTGIWTILSGDGGSFVDATDPGTGFSGQIAETYELEWRISTNCYSSADVVTVSFLAVFVCGNDFVDPRDEQVYPTKLIGDQCWMAKNMNVGAQIFTGSPPANNAIIEKFCYNNQPINCEQYGGLYLWNEAMNYTTTEGSQGICPDGWRIPKDSEWVSLLNFVGTSSSCKLRIVGDDYWTNNECATDEFGFAARGAGRTNSYSSFLSLKSGTFFWTSTEGSTSDRAFQYSFFNFSEEVSQFNHLKSDGMSVRCIKSN
jgi:uncharacterized protein (TIGR02145 family)